MKKLKKKNVGSECYENLNIARGIFKETCTLYIIGIFQIL